MLPAQVYSDLGFDRGAAARVFLLVKRQHRGGHNPALGAVDATNPDKRGESGGA